MMTAPMQAAAKKSPHNRGRVSGMHVEPLDNGVVVNTHFEPKKPGGPYPEPERKAFDNHAEMLAHLAKHTAPMFDEEPEEEPKKK